MQNKRRRVWIDRFQTHLSLRMAAYIFVYLFVLSIFVAFWSWFWQAGVIQMRPIGWQDFLGAIVGSLVFAPIILWDAIKFSHRLVGPMARFRKAIQDITAGKKADPIKLRKGDFLGTLRDDFNEMVEKMTEKGYFEEEKPESKRDSRESVLA